ncbi:MAG: DMT family transporter [Oscillospiraceae bacterium]|jgi:drug/metabolite transporter (DMT)-like permease|nr:DMT family transporter [Oscillospiraceae bacterium]
MPLDSKKKFAVLGRLSLVVTTLIWGTSFVVLKNTLALVPTLYIMAIRFSGAAALLALVFVRELRKTDRRYIINGIVLGILLFLGYTVQTYGLYYTTPSKNAFLTASYCVLVPFVIWAFYKKRPDRYHLISAAICLAGVGFVSLKGGWTVEFGDILTLCCGVFYAVHIVLTAKYVQGRSVPLLTMIQFATAGILAWAFALLTGPLPALGAGNIVWSLAYLSVMCTGLCFLCQTFGQKHTPAAAAAIILSLESVFGSAFSVLFGQETLTGRLYAGFALIFAAVLISETKLSFLKKKPAAAPAGTISE